MPSKAAAIRKAERRAQLYGTTPEVAAKQLAKKAKRAQGK